MRRYDALLCFPINRNIVAFIDAIMATDTSPASETSKTRKPSRPSLRPTLCRLCIELVELKVFCNFETFIAPGRKAFE